MPLSWNEIKINAINFARKWQHEKREEAEAKSFWDEFIRLFGLERAAVASFEEPVKTLKGTYGFIDLFWKGVLLVEHKSRGQSLEKANSQAMEYIQNLQREGRGKEVPPNVIVCDFARFVYYDLKNDRTVEFPLEKLPEHIYDFAFIPGYKIHSLEPQDPINIEAVDLLGDLHDSLEGSGYTGHDLERFLVRILFCLFAEDTGLFPRESFKLFIENRTDPDGENLGGILAQLFQCLDKPVQNRMKSEMWELQGMPYVNGDLFKERLEIVNFTRFTRERLIECCKFDWSRISPAIFGSLFQSVMEPKERRKVGAHYTSERDILKLVGSLFLDDLKAEFERLKENRGTQREARLMEFHRKIGALKFLDPACGCGNFLVVTYRELRLLEIGLLKELYGSQQKMLDVLNRSLIDVDSMYGIEINEFPARIAEVALWLCDHQMNQRLSEAFGEYCARLPLKKSATIRHANALRVDWNEVLPAKDCSCVLGNPPFIGAKFQSAAQRDEVATVATGVRNAGLLDYVCAWYFKAADYTKETKSPAGFVSTNSVSQGEQVGVLWGELFRRGIKIHFAHRTFPWKSEARGAAHVHVVIVGFGHGDTAEKRIYDYDQDLDNPTVTVAKNISPYFVEGSDTVVVNRRKPLCSVPEIKFGNQPIDGGFLLLDDEQKREINRECPKAKKWIRLYLGSREFINGQKRWCLWLKDALPNELRDCIPVMRRIEEVKKFRLASNRPDTVRLATAPAQFAFVSHTEKEYLIIPSASSERRRYIPIGFLPANVIASNLCLIVPGATVFDFGILTSTMHMAWVRQVCGRLKSDYRYSASLVYNNFPWPMQATDAQKATVEAKAQAVLDARALFPEATLADLYDPNTMPPALTKAHAELDRAVEKCYRKEPFAKDRERVEFLFGLYEKLVNPLTATAPKNRRRRTAEE